MQRCKIVLLKSDGEVAVVLDTNELSVNNWLKRYGSAGIEVLNNKRRQGMNPILKEEHLSIVRDAVEQER